MFPRILQLCNELSLQCYNSFVNSNINGNINSFCNRILFDFLLCSYDQRGKCQRHDLLYNKSHITVSFKGLPLHILRRATLENLQLKRMNLPVQEIRTLGNKWCMKGENGLTVKYYQLTSYIKVIRVPKASFQCLLEH